MILWFSYIDDGNFFIYLCIWHLAQVGFMNESLSIILI